MLPSLQQTHATPYNSDVVISHSRPVDTSDQEQPRKRTRCLRSCLACRKAKQRCSLPDSFIEPSNDPLPSHLACSRCILLENECYVVDVAPRPSQSSGRSRAGSRAQQPRTSQHTAPSTTHTKQTRNEKMIEYDGTIHQPQLNGFHQSRTDSGDQATLIESSASPPPVNDLRLFDPDIVKDLIVKSEDKKRVLSESRVIPPKKTMDWIKVGMTVCRPFELLGYLLRKQSISRHLFVESQRPADILVDLLIPFQDLDQRYQVE
jgi:hypothetical protein